MLNDLNLAEWGGIKIFEEKFEEERFNGTRGRILSLMKY